MLLFWNRPAAQASDAAWRTRERLSKKFIFKMERLHKAVLQTGQVTTLDLQDAYRKFRTLEKNSNCVNIWYTLGVMTFIMVATPIFYESITFLLGIRCFLPNNYLVWEATRPISDCGFCRSVRKPLILQNMSREDFAPFAYSSHPIIIKKAVAHWPAMRVLNFEFLKRLYEHTSGALDENCKFLHYHSDFKNLRDVFGMSPQRANLTTGNIPWYVGWSNCNPLVIRELQKLYPRPHFLPVDAEMPNTNYVFIGFEEGSFMNVDYIPRLMWQAQLQGNKTWIVAPTPECDHVCQSFSFYVEPGDAVLVDTRFWYHGTSMPKGQFALTIQSEYG